MGDSDRLDNSGPDSYTYVEQRKYLFALLEQLGVTENVTLAIHDWESGLGFHWAHTHADAVKGIAPTRAQKFRYKAALVGQKGAALQCANKFGPRQLTERLAAV